MFKKIALALFCGVMLAGVAIAQDAPVVLTPTKLYDMIEGLQKRCFGIGEALKVYDKRFDALERKLEKVEAREDERGDKTLKALLNTNQRIQKLERKAAGMQKDGK